LKRHETPSIEEKHRIGLIGFYIDDEEIYIGISLCNPADKFNAARAKGLVLKKLSRLPTYIDTVQNFLRKADSVGITDPNDPKYILEGEFFSILRLLGIYIPNKYGSNNMIGAAPIYALLYNIKTALKPINEKSSRE
jgi:hypothetical protein